MPKQSRDLICDDFHSAYIEMTDTRKNTFSRLCNKLFNENFIYGGKQEDRQDYYLLLEYKEIITNYFLMMDYELIYDDTSKIFFLETNLDRNRKNLSKLDTIILIILRLLYYRGSTTISEVNNIVITLRDLINEINTTGIYKSNITKTDYLKTLRLLKRVKVIDADIKPNITEDLRIEIYPTIIYVVRTDDIQTLNNKISGFVNEKQDKMGEYMDETEED